MQLLSVTTEMNATVVQLSNVVLTFMLVYEIQYV